MDLFNKNKVYLCGTHNMIWITLLFIWQITPTQMSFQTRAISNSSKNQTILIFRIWKMNRNLFSSLDIRDLLKVAYLGKNPTNPTKNLVTLWSCQACLKDRFCIVFFVIVIVLVIMHISNVYLLVLSKATGQTLQKHYD